MPAPGTPLRSLGFLTIGLFDAADPGPGHRSTLEIVELGEQLGFDSVWLRHRHLQFGISSPMAMLAAASQRTSRIRFGTAVTPLGWENPLRLAEDAGTADVLSGGRVELGVSVGPPRHFDALRDALYPDTAETEDFSHTRVERLLAMIAGERVSSVEGTEGQETYSARVEPHSPGLRSRVWYGAGSLRSARWAGEHAVNLLTSSVVTVEDETAGLVTDAGAPDFAAIQAEQIRLFRSLHPDGAAARVSQGLVVIPTDSASSDQRARYEAYVAARDPRTSEPQGPGRLVFARDIVGTSEHIAEQLYAHAGFREVDEVAFALPFTFTHEDYVQILTDLARHLGPLLGWRPAS